MSGSSKQTTVSGRLPMDRRTIFMNSMVGWMCSSVCRHSTMSAWRWVYFSE